MFYQKFLADWYKIRRMAVKLFNKGEDIYSISRKLELGLKTTRRYLRTKKVREAFLDKYIYIPLRNKKLYPPRKGEGLIYALRCPIDNKIKYIGKTLNLPRRMMGHRNPCAVRRKYNRNLYDWMMKLRFKNLEPIVVLLEKIKKKYLNQCERKWISTYAKKTLLFNKNLLK